MANYNERIAETKEKIEQYKNQMKELVQKQKAQERKDRTRRLIERGAIAESLIDGAETLTNEQFKILLENAVKSEYGRKILSGVKSQDSEPAAPKPAGAEQYGGTATAQIVGNGAGKAG